MKKAYIFLAEGFEDIEALGTCDALRRGGVDVELVGIGEDPFVSSSHGVLVSVDSTLEQGIGIEKSDAMIFPGGMPGTKNLAACRPLMEAMREHHAEGGLVAAICAAPGLVLGQLDDFDDVEFTCYDGFEEIPSAKGGKFVKKPAVTCGNIITGRSAGHAVAFGLEILKYLRDEQTAEKVRYSFDLTCE